MPRSKRKYKHKKSVLYSQLDTLTFDVTCSKLLRYEENIGNKKLSVEYTLRNYVNYDTMNTGPFNLFSYTLSEKILFNEYQILREKVNPDLDKILARQNYPN